MQRSQIFGQTFVADNLTSIAGHAYAPGFEPSFFQRFMDMLAGMGVTGQAAVAGLCAIGGVFVIASRVRFNMNRRKKRSLFVPLQKKKQSWFGKITVIARAQGGLRLDTLVTTKTPRDLRFGAGHEDPPEDAPLAPGQTLQDAANELRQSRGGAGSRGPIYARRSKLKPVATAPTKPADG